MTASGNRPQATGAAIATWTVHAPNAVSLHRTGQGPRAVSRHGTVRGGPSTSPAMGFTIRAFRAFRAEWPNGRPLHGPKTRLKTHAARAGGGPPRRGGGGTPGGGGRVRV